MFQSSIVKSSLANGISYIVEAKEIEHITLPKFAMHDYPIQCGLFTDINPLMAILMNIKDSIIDTIMYISPHDKPCPRKCGKLLPKKGEKKRVYKKQDSNQ